MSFMFENLIPDESGLDRRYFEELRSRIHGRLKDPQRPDSQRQIDNYPWLYGALGSVPASIMFICENPSQRPVEAAHAIDDGPADIEAQWWGGKKNNAAKRFRFALYETGLKTTPPSERGGWNCYITNVVKEMNFATDQGRLKAKDRHRQARRWSDILAWEYAQVEPQHVVCVGDNAEVAVARLQREGHLPTFRLHKICHYSDRGPGRTDAVVRQRMIDGIRAMLNSDHTSEFGQ